MYKTLGFKWFCQVFCPTSAFATADRDEARNPQRFIHVTVRCQLKKPLALAIRIQRTVFGRTEEEMRMLAEGYGGKLQ
jgi:hypothetical protein